MGSTESVANRIKVTLKKILGSEPILHQSAFPDVYFGDIDLSHIFRRYDEPSRFLVIGDENAPIIDIRKQYFVLQSNAINLVFHTYKGEVAYRSVDAIHLSLDDYNSLQQISEHRPRERKTNFAKFLVGMGPSGKHNPFQTQRAASERMFFDRRRERRELLAVDKWKVMVGPRQIGKTSLAWAVHRDLSRDPSTIIDVDGASVFPAALMRCLDLTTETFWEAIYDRIGQSKKDQAEGRRHALTDPTKRTYRRLSAYESFKNLTTTIYLRPYVFLDELDPLVVEDRAQGWIFFNQLRGWAEEAQASLVLIGYVELDNALRESSFPFFQRCTLVKLSTMPQEDAERLITMPIIELGHQIDPTAVRLIYSASGGGPAQLQNICRILIDSVENNKQISRDDAKRAIEASEVDGDYASFVGEATPMARLVVVLIADELGDRNPSWKELIEGSEDGYADKLLALMEKVSDFIEGQELDAARLGDKVAEQLRDHVPVHIGRSLYRSALDELSLRYVLRQKVPYASYGYVGGYFFARTMLDMLTGQHRGYAEDLADEISEIEG